ncbi:MAG: 23S rRNA pseudouridine1911/1915/1917 synthase [Patiriisocius sp.]|jgi:23S rRNA pseudouridine1911/1915/1917 synthase
MSEDSRIVSTEHNLDVLYEDNHLIIINKRSGDICQGDQTGDTPVSDLVKLFLKEKYDKPGNVFAGVVHRLDRPTSGALILAKTSKALSRMNEQFRKNEIKKTYWALADKRPQEMSGRLHHFLKKDEQNNKSKAHKKNVPGGKESILEYDVISEQNRITLFELNPHTGRHHQIRVQLSSIGCPILGDGKYGSSVKSKNGRLYLHARTIEFMHPTKKELMKITAPLPQDVLWRKFN